MGMILKLVAGIGLGMGIRVAGTVWMGINICPHAALQYLGYSSVLFCLFV